jgi:hypothetical protein
MRSWIVLPLCLCVGCSGNAGDEPTQLRAKANDKHAQLKRDLHAEIAKVHARFHDCNRMIGDAYRAMGQPNYKVNFSASFYIHTESQTATISKLMIKLPIEAPPDATLCFKEKFPTSFLTSVDFDGEYNYPMCVSVLPEPPD